MRYFHIANGLRGCYMPDNSFVVAVKTRRELKFIVKSECDAMREAFGYGGNAKFIASAVAFMWRDAKNKRKSHLPVAIGFGRTRKINDRPFGVFIGHATRGDYIEQSED